MTEPAILRLMLLAAGAGGSASEFRNFIDALYESSPSDVLRAYDELRRKIRHIQETEHKQIGMELNVQGPTRTVRNDIIQLTKRSNIKMSDAVELIRVQLLAMPNIDGSTIAQFNSREGFSRWIEKIAKVVGPSILLNVAAAVLIPENTN